MRISRSRFTALSRTRAWRSSEGPSWQGPGLPPQRPLPQIRGALDVENSVFSEPQPQSLVVNMRQKRKQSCPKASGLSTGVARLPGCRRPRGSCGQDAGPHSVLPGSGVTPPPSQAGPPDPRTTTRVQPSPATSRSGGRRARSHHSETVRRQTLDPTRHVVNKDVHVQRCLRAVRCPPPCRGVDWNDSSTRTGVSAARGRGPGSSSGVPGATASSDRLKT